RQLEVASLEARVTEAFWSALPVETAGTLKRLRLATRLRSDSADEFTRCTVALDAYRDALERAMALAPALEASYRAMPSRPPPIAPRSRPARRSIRKPDNGHGASKPSSITFLPARSLERKLRRIVQTHDRNARIEGLGSLVQRAEFTALGAPLVLLAEITAGL